MSTVPMTKSKLFIGGVSTSASASETTRILELENKVKALEAENIKLKSSSSDALHNEIKKFGISDYNRLRKISYDVKRISPVTDPELVSLSNLLNDAIRDGQIKLMDKESGSAFAASGVVGFDGDKLLIFNER